MILIKCMVKFNLILMILMILARWITKKYLAPTCMCTPTGLSRNNAITDGGVALPKFLLTIVMKLSNFKSQRISRNS